MRYINTSLPIRLCSPPRITLNGSARFVFYGLFKEDHPEAVTSLEFQDELQAAWQQAQAHRLTDSGHSLPLIERSERLGSLCGHCR